ncbi:MAG: GtrA family protein [Rhodocyclaceae bacterium]
MKRFTRYSLIGVLNTAIHWSVFSVVLWADGRQSLANVVGFVGAASFSFFANARLTFRSSATPSRYVLFMCFMGGSSYFVGWVGDWSGMHPLITLIVFSLFSLIAGFLFSRHIVFGGRDSGNT